MRKTFLLALVFVLALGLVFAWAEQSHAGKKGSTDTAIKVVPQTVSQQSSENQLNTAEQKSLIKEKELQEAQQAQQEKDQAELAVKANLERQQAEALAKEQAEQQRLADEQAELAHKQMLAREAELAEQQNTPQISQPSEADLLKEKASELGISPEEAARPEINIPYQPPVITAVGDDCTDPYIIDINTTGDLPIALTGMTTCGHGNTYDNTCMGSYDGGEDFIFQINNNTGSNLPLSISCQSSDTYGAIALHDACPLDPTTCLAVAASTDNPDIIEYTIGPGSYYVMVDLWPSPSCIDFDITFDTYAPPTGRCCDYTTPLSPICTDGVLEADCIGPVYEWTEGLDCTTPCTVPSEGDNCLIPLQVSLPAEMPYSDLGQTTQNRGDNKTFTTCGYSQDEDMVYQLNVTSEVTVNITIDPGTTAWTSVAVVSACDGSGDCLDYSNLSSSGVHGIEALNLPVGTYYLWVDSYIGSGGDYIPSFDLSITEWVPPTGRCCDNTDPLNPTCADGVVEADCQDANEVWAEGLNCTDDPCPVPTIGDNCAVPIVVTSGDLPYSVTGQTTCGLTNDYSNTCLDYYDSDPDIIYSFTNNLTESIFLNIDMTNSSNDYIGMLVSDDCPTTTDCLDYTTGGNGVYDIHLAGVEVTAGNTVFIMVDSDYEYCTGGGYGIDSFDLAIDGVTAPPTGRCCYYDEDPPDLYDPLCASPVTEDDCNTLIGAFSGNWTIDGDCTTDPCPVRPANDECANAETITPGNTITVNNEYATDDTISTHDIHRNIWFCYTATMDGIALIDMCPTTFDTKMTVYEGCGCDPLGDEIGYNDDDNFAFCAEDHNQSALQIFITSGQSYLIEVGSYGTTTYGDLVLTVTESVTPTGRCCYYDEDPPDLFNPLCASEVTELECDALIDTFSGTWSEGLDCTDPCPAPHDFDGTENFDTDLNMGSFTNYSNDSTSTNWTWNSTGGNPDGCAYHSWASVGDGEDDYLISNGSYMVPDEAYISLSWDQKASFASDYVLHQVGVSTDFTGDPETATWNWLYTGPATSSWETITVSLDAYRGHGIAIAFNYQGYNADGWYVDNVKVQLPPSGRCCDYSVDPQNPTCTADTYQFNCDGDLMVWTEGEDCTAPCVPAPVNDFCENAEVVSGPYPATGSGTTIMAFPDCIPDWNTVWYDITLPYTWNDIVITVCPTTENLVNAGLNLVRDCSCGGMIGASDYTWPYTSCSEGYNGLQMTFSQVYQGDGSILWPAFIMGTGLNDGTDFNYTIEVTEATTPPDGDQCANPIVVAFDENMQYTDSQNSCDYADNFGQAGSDVVYEFTLDGVYSVTMSLCNSVEAFDSYMWLMPGDGCGEAYITYDDDACGTETWLSQISDVVLTAGTYYIGVDAYEGECGNYTLDISAELAPVTIYDIQYTDEVGSGCYDSPLDGQIVHTSGVVTGIIQGTYPDYFIQDCTDSDWNGIYMYDLSEVSLGDKISFDAEVDEYTGLTELKNISNLTIDSSGVALCTLSVTSDQVGDSCAAEPEAYESMLVTLQGVTCVVGPDGYNVAYVKSDGATDSCAVDDEMYKNGTDQPDPLVAGEMYDITGIVYYKYGIYKVYPRFASDVVLLQQGYQYLPGDANMYNGAWPPAVIGSDVTYLVNFFRGLESNPACNIDGNYMAADVNGSCTIIGSDVTRLVNFFRGSGVIEPCPDWEPVWHNTSELPENAPDGWPNCDEPTVVSGKQTLSKEIAK